MAYNIINNLLEEFLMSGLISINGRITPIASAGIPAEDRGFAYGDGVFETFVAFHGQCIAKEMHYARLREGCETLGIAIPWNDLEFDFEIDEMLRQVSAPKAVIRIVVTRGSGLGLIPKKGMIPNKYIYVMSTDGVARADGLRLEAKKNSGITREPQAKGLCYASSIKAMMQAEKRGVDDILWMNGEDEITESSSANIFFIGRQGDLVDIHTPSSYSGLLEGITRKIILELLGRAKIKAEETVIYYDELARYDEAFLCSSVKGLVPIKLIDNHVLHTLKGNSVFRKIEQLFLTWVRSEIGYEVDWGTGKKK